jgi:phosphoglycolate phosphatase-like HAD superfamily hydrolase
MIKLIVFDWDDVITLGSKEGYFKCYHEAMVGSGVFLDPKEERKRILAKWGKSQLEELRELLKDQPELLDTAHEIYERNLFGSTFSDELRMMDGTNDLLRRLGSKYILCVATAVNPKLLREVVMPKFKVPDVFSQIISACDLEDADKHKPHPYMLEEIMRTQGVKPEHTVFVGDSKMEVIMSRAAHVEPIVVLTGHLNRKEAEELGVKYIISDVTKLESVLSALNRT